MIKRLLKSVGEYKLPTILTPIFIIGEAVIEALMPFIIANLINNIKAGCNMSDIAKNGGILFIMACISLTCGGLAGFTASKASAGFAKNLRKNIFYKIQDFSFENIDKFSLLQE